MPEETCFAAALFPDGLQCAARPVFRVTAIGWWRGRRFGARMVCSNHVPVIVAGLGWPCRVEFVGHTEPLDVLRSGGV